ncbi:MAG TPA: ubiquitin-like domain-containing protein [Mycobacteriales bacterium]|nr:ubiquitin-like domain-containing protein [Mycobacteriales bacterium]
MRRSPLALALFAAVIATLTVATTAFATMEKTVRLDVDGHQVSVRTFADDVAGVLRKAHLGLGPHDAVAPDPAAPVHDGSRVVVRHGRVIRLTIGGRVRQVWVTALSVGEALKQLQLRADGAWLSASRSETIPRHGLSLQLRLPQHVTVLVDGRRKTSVTTAPTVRALLHDLHVRLRRLDKVNVPLARYPRTGLVVSVDRISQRTVTENLAIPFATKQIRTESLYVGETRVVRYGQPGLRVATYRITWRNRRLVGRRLVASQLRSRPVTQVEQVGTKPRPQHSPSADGLNWAALANCESGGNPRAVSSNGEYRGLYQFTMGTWASVGGSGDPIDASSSEQTYRAQLLYRRSGDSVWPVCGHYLYT